MPVEVLLSQFGMGMQDGKILQWYVAVGDTVAEGQPLCEVETAKTVAEVEAPAAGVVSRIVVPAEETANVRDLIAVIEAAGEAASAPTPAPSQAAPPAAIAALKPAAGGPSAQVEPRARRRASELGVDLAQVTGSGPAGRITEADVERHGRGAAQPAPAKPVARFGFIKIVVGDVAGARAFYEGVFGLAPTKIIDEDGFTEIMLRDPANPDGPALVLYHDKVRPFEGIGPGWGPVGLYVGDVDAVYADALARGGQASRPPFSYGEYRLAFVRGPEGHEIELLAVTGAAGT